MKSLRLFLVASIFLLSWMALATSVLAKLGKMDSVFHQPVQAGPLVEEIIVTAPGPADASTPASADLAGRPAQPGRPAL